MSLFRDNRRENRGEIWPKTLTEDKSQRWIILDYFWDGDASHSQPVLEWHHGFQRDYPTRMPSGAAGSRRITMFGMNYSTTVAWFNASKYPAGVLGLSEQRCVRPLAWTTVKKKSFKHNDSWNGSSENAAKCQAFAKQQFGRGNEDTSRRTISVCRVWSTVGKLLNKSTSYAFRGERPCEANSLYN